ncbi:polysaccharide deacetylase family protein (plasmid) [Roseobacter sp. A03A-229]
MYHHFHDDTHPVGQGSISAQTFDDLICCTKRLGVQYLDPQDYIKRALDGTLEDNQTALTFDDSLRCQFDVALPVMKAHDLRGFFFCYTNLALPNVTTLEFFRDFRNVFFDDIEAFYSAFFSAVRANDDGLLDPAHDAIKTGFLGDCPFFTYNDKVYRYVRDYVLGPKDYDKVMKSMMAATGYPFAERAALLLMSPEMIHELNATGHEVGLHSHSHPMVMTQLTKEEQTWEYQTNHEVLQMQTGQAAVSMSHPCGHYDERTLKILRDLGVTVGFRSTITKRQIVSPLEIPREDHANLVRDLL